MIRPVLHGDARWLMLSPRLNGVSCNGLQGTANPPRLMRMGVHVDASPDVCYADSATAFGSSSGAAPVVIREQTR